MLYHRIVRPDAERRVALAFRDDSGVGQHLPAELDACFILLSWHALILAAGVDQRSHRQPPTR